MNTIIKRITLSLLLLSTVGNSCAFYGDSVKELFNSWFQSTESKIALAVGCSVLASIGLYKKIEYNRRAEDERQQRDRRNNRLIELLKEARRTKTNNMHILYDEYLLCNPEEIDNLYDEGLHTHVTLFYKYIDENNSEWVDKTLYNVCVTLGVLEGTVPPRLSNLEKIFNQKIDTKSVSTK